MSKNNKSKDLVPVAKDASVAVTKGPKPVLMQVGKGWICSTGMFHPALAVQYIRDRPRDKWIKVGELARVFTGANTIPGKKRVRKQLPSVFRRFLDLNEFMLQHTKERGRIEAVKLLARDSEMERQQADTQLHRMQKQHELTTDKYAKALKVLGIFEQIAIAPTSEDGQ